MRGYQPGLSFVLAIGLLGGSVGVVAAQDAEPPIEFTGRLSFGPQVGPGTQERVEGRNEIRGSVFSTPVAAMSDPRLDGAWTRTNNLDQYDEPSVLTWQALWRVETEDGAWAGIETPIVFSDGSRSTTTAVLVGEDGYEGLTAVIEFEQGGDAWDLRGFIIDGEMPPLPEAEQ